MNRILIIASLLFSSLLLKAQSIEGGIFFGVSNYQGDLVEPIIEFQETKLAYGLLLRYNLFEYVSLRASFYGGSISGNDAHAQEPGRIARDARFSAKLYELSVNGEWNILGSPFSNYIDAKKRFVYPYVSVGLGVNYVDPMVTQGGDILDPEKLDYEKVTMALPFCGGLKFKVNDKAVLGLEAGFRTTFSDYLDGISKLGNPAGNDWYLFAGISIAAVLGSSY